MSVRPMVRQESGRVGAPMRRQDMGEMSSYAALVTTPDLDYCRANFRFALLKHRPISAADDLILRRESFWKRLLLTRGDQGLNRN